MLSADHIVGLAFPAALLVLFAVLAWKFRRGEWLNLIAGNNFVTKEEMQLPYQRELGRKMSVWCMAPAMLMCASLLVTGVGDAVGSREAFAAGLVLCAVFCVAMLAGIARIMIWSNRLARQEREQRLADAKQAGERARKRAEDDARLEKRQMAVIVAIIVVMLAFYLLAVPLLKQAAA